MKLITAHTNYIISRVYFESQRQVFPIATEREVLT